MGADEQLEAVLENAARLSDAVIANCDDWGEGRAYAWNVRTTLRDYRVIQQTANPGALQDKG